jgi:hypothetical protein
MKRFDFANDVAKQLITITSAIITVVIAFYEKFFSHSTATFVLVFLVLLVFIASIILGVLTIGALVDLVEQQEIADGKKPQPAHPVFIKLRGTNVQTWARRQQILFALGLLFFIVVAILDRSYLSNYASNAAPAGASSAPVERPIVWAQLRPDTDAAKGELIGRAVVGRGETCPDAVIGGKRLNMVPRSGPAHPGFARTVCEVAYPGDQEATIAGVTLKARRPSLERILVIGDTGCRLTHYVAQECNDPAKWPFQTIADAAAKLEPQLIIHVGDYHYREKPCADRAGCSGSPSGDNWRTWQKEFFDPAAALLPAAPWLMLRGNLENCGRAGNGWLLLLSPELRDQLGGGCKDDIAPYVLGFDRLTMAVLDTAAAEDYGAAARSAKYRDRIPALAKQFAERSAGGGDKWLLLHQPLWVSYGNCGSANAIKCEEADLFSDIASPGGSNAAKLNLSGSLAKELRDKTENPMHAFRQWIEGKIEYKTDDAKTASVAAPAFSLVLSGDTHMFQMFAPDSGFPNHPVQLVAGMSGDILEKDFTFPKEITGGAVKAKLFGVDGQLWLRRQFGFMYLVRKEADWVATLHGAQGQVLLTCNMTAKSCS